MEERILKQVGGLSPPLQKEAGFTLIETIVALAVILAAVVGPVSLITQGLFSVPTSKNRLIAINLAQEGIELVRAVRENNVLCDSVNGPANWQWDRDPTGNITDGYYAVAVDSLTAINQANCGTPADVTTPQLSLSTNTGEILSHDGAFYGNAGTPTAFSRYVFVDFDPPSPSSPNPQSPDSDIPSADQLDIISTVMWNERGSPRNVMLKERIYNWR